VNLREDIMRAARAAVWARAVDLRNRAITPERREKLLWDTARFLAHLRAGAVWARGDIPEKVHPWGCVLRNDYPHIINHIDCGKFWLYLRDEVSEAAIEAAAAELRPRARTAGTVVWMIGVFPRPAPPDYARIARSVIHFLRAKLSDLDLAAMSNSEELEIRVEELANAAALAAIEAGNWVAEVESYPPYPSIPFDISNSNINTWVYSGRVKVEIHPHYNESREVLVWISATRAPRALRPAFAAAYARWYGRFASATLARRLEEAGA